jgi:hypothetical protein
MAEPPEDDRDDPWANASSKSDSSDDTDDDGSGGGRTVLLVAGLVVGGILLIVLMVVMAAVVGTFVLDLGQNVEASPVVGASFEQATTDGSGDVVVTLTSVTRADRVSVNCAGTGFEDIGGTEEGTAFSCVADHDGLGGGLSDGDVVTVRATYDGTTAVMQEYTYTA